MDPQYEDLRGAIYTNPQEMKRFRQLIVNSLLATDIFDKELGALRKSRWLKAFSPSDGSGADNDAKTSVNRKATIVIEHIIQVRTELNCICHDLNYGLT